MRNKKGILLFEVLVAMAILAIGLTFVSRSFTNCLRVVELAGDYNKASMLAGRVLADLENIKEGELPTEGKFDEEPLFGWDLETTDIEDLELREIKLGIKWKRRNRDYRLSVSEYIR